MQSRTRLNIALLGGLIVIGLLFWLSFRDQAGGDPLLDRTVADIEHIEVRVDGMPSWSAQQGESGWQIRTPLIAPAHPERLNSLLSLLRLPVHGRYSVEEVDLARFGLDAPLLEIRVDGETLWVGDEEPVNRRRYVRKGEEVLLLDDIFYFQFDRPPQALVDHRLLPRDSAIKAIDFGRYQLAQVSGGRWDFSGDVPEEMAVGDADQLAGNWREAQAGLVLAPDPEAPEADGRITVEMADGRERRFDFFLAEDHFILYSPENAVRYRFPMSQRSALIPDA